MGPFSYSQAPTEEAAVHEIASHDGAMFVAGGTCLIDLMKLDVMTPTHLVDINSAPLSEIATLPDGSLRVGALARNSDMAYNETLRTRYPLLSSAILNGASAQLRNMATLGGNLMQRTRCYYFRDTATPCNKREPRTGCPAIEGINRIHAVLGTSSRCIAAHPSDMAVALVALDAIVHVRGPRGERTIPIVDFHLLPGNHPERETALEPGELITAVDVPPLGWAVNSTYLKIRDRASYAFALVSVAAALDVKGGTIRNARLALGGVGTKPWRVIEAERALVGKPPNRATFADAAEIALRGAKPYKDNGFKIDLAKRTIVRALTRIGGPA